MQFQVLSWVWVQLMLVFGDVVTNVNATDSAVDKPVGDYPVGPLRDLFESEDTVLPTTI